LQPCCWTAGSRAACWRRRAISPSRPDPAGDEGIKAALQTLVETLKPAGATCVLGIPTTLVSFRNLSVPFHDLKKIRQILPFELEPSLPVPVEDLIFDFEAVKAG
jgi:general secretion pathway protein L